MIDDAIKGNKGNKENEGKIEDHTSGMRKGGGSFSPDQPVNDAPKREEKFTKEKRK